MSLSRIARMDSALALAELRAELLADGYCTELNPGKLPYNPPLPPEARGVLTGTHTLYATDGARKYVGCIEVICGAPARDLVRRVEGTPVFVALYDHKRWDFVWAPPRR